MSTRRFLTAEQIARTVPGYEHDVRDVKSHEAFQRMFERDKSELRRLGIPLETGSSSVFDSESGYRIAPSDYALPEIDLTPDEAAAVALAGKWWREGGLAEAAQSGLRKLVAGGAALTGDNPFGVQPAIRQEAALEPLLAAIRERRQISFDYVRPADVTPVSRRLQPWSVTASRGRWYVVGYDLDRADRRSFRLSRIRGEVKLGSTSGSYEIPESDERAESATGSATPRVTARLAIAAGRAAGMRRWADSISTDADGREIVTISFVSVQGLASYVVAAGDAVVVLDPPELRDEVIVRLKGLVDRS